MPEQLIDVVEPFFKVIVEQGYDRSIPPGEPTPARLIPTLNPETVTADLVNAIGEGITNAAALIGAPKPLSIPAAPAHADQDAVESQYCSRAQSSKMPPHKVSARSFEIWRLPETTSTTPSVR